AAIHENYDDVHMLPAAIQSDIGSILTDIQALGMRVTDAQFDAPNFGNYIVDLDGTAGRMRITRDRGQYIIDGNEDRIREMGLFRAFDLVDELRSAVMAYVRSSL
ncbi:MAG: hypothetical protein ACRC6L_01615, partial [Steroidobacteraceae bacterium]